MRSETQPYSTVLQYGCVALRMRFFSQNFGTIKRILPGSSSPSHREGPGTEVDHQLTKQYHQLCAAVLYVATSFFASEFENILVGTVSETAGLVIGQTRIGRLWLLERDLAGVGCCTTKDEMVGGQGSEVVCIQGVDCSQGIRLPQTLSTSRSRTGFGSQL